jgi:hypothetical protein
MSNFSNNAFSEVPKLNLDGSNWMSFHKRMLWALQGRLWMGHIDGTAVRPVDITPADPADPTLAEIEAMDQQLECQRLHDRDAFAVYNSIMSRLPDGIAICLCVQPNAQHLWEALEDEHLITSEVLLMNKRTQMGEKRCKPNGNI